ncbi:MAG TPA: RNA polymerase sigma-70 factor, partial [Gemmatimonadaceae bacterium]
MPLDAFRPSTRYERPAPLVRDDAVDVARVDRIRQGDQSAFEEVYREHYGALVGFVYTYLRSEPLAEEEVQDLFLAVWRHRTEWQPRTTLRAYLFKAARNRALNRLRNQGVTTAVWEDAAAEGRTLAMGETPPALDQQVEADELAEAARSAIARLAPRCRMAFVLCREEGLSYAETAEVMGISEHTVKIQMGRALKALR